MAKGKAPAMPLYVSDMMNDEAVKLMNNREFGCYMKLLGHNWTEGSIPADMPNLSLIVNEDQRDFEIIWEKIRTKFRQKGGRAGGARLTNSRVEKERKRRSEFVHKQRRASIEMWKHKKSENRPNHSAPSEPSHSQKDAKPMPARAQCSFSSSSSLTTTTEPPAPQPASEYKITTPLQKAVCGWKVITGIAENDRAWDKLNWPRTVKSIKELMDFFEGDHIAVIDCCQDVYEDLTRKSLTCTIETVKKFAAEWRTKHGKNKPAPKPFDGGGPILRPQDAIGQT